MRQQTSGRTEEIGFTSDRQGTTLTVQRELLTGLFRPEEPTSALWGRVNFVRVRLEDSWFVNWPPPTVLAISTRLGLAGPYGGTDDLVIEDRFKAGGSTTIRGYPLDRVGPVDSANNPTVCSASRPPLGRSAAPTSSASSCSPDPRRGRPGRDHRGAGRH